MENIEDSVNNKELLQTIPEDETIGEIEEEDIHEEIEVIEKTKKPVKEKVDKRKKGNYKMTPARQNAINKMLEARQQKLKEKRELKEQNDVEKLQKKKEKKYLCFI